MKSLFNAKWLTFYGTTIAFVIALFSIVTNYGEANLTAPTKISGRYKISGKTLPGCLKDKDLILAIGQSGIYLNGSLLESDHSTHEATASRKRPSLTGQFNPPKLELSGTLSQIPDCKNAAIVMKSTIAQNTLNGHLSLNNTSSNFVAQLEK
jgi:hypothetical protein